MSTRELLANLRRLERPAIVAAVVPTLVGVVAFVKGYPIPADGGEFVTVTGSGVLLGFLGLASWWWYEHGRPTAAAVAMAGVGVAVGWSLFRPGVRAVRVGGDVVLAGDPVLARFVGVSPWLVLVVGVVGIVEPVLPGLRAFADGEAAFQRQTRRGAVQFGAMSGVALALLSVLPVYFLEGGFGDVTLLGLSLGGGFAGMLLVAYLFARHNLVTPVLGVGVVTTAAAVAVTAGGSPLGYPTAWVVWLLPGLTVGGIEAVGRRLVSATR